ncbi:hypothetical protein PILCRDRAFT_17332 [Piloderma croceum F 1598]|uniref:Uncharacterized protein n=1 Tax=Piloderma croceum (strain F 1598) TaxID=765440 RepID=A0A0C3B1P2_PILCF|nr:hypothetical protein PILCRDRAFT_17332 [Piloderma croceum F 1598]
MSSISTGYVALYADDSDSEDDLDPGDSVSQRQHVDKAKEHFPSAMPQAPTVASSLSDITLSDIGSEVFDLPPSPLYATTKTVTTSTTTTTYTYTPLPLPTKPADDLSISPRPKSVASQPSRPVGRGRSVESKRTRTHKPSEDTGHAFIFPHDVSASKSSLVPKASAPAILLPSCSSTAKPPKSMLAKYAFPNPARYPYR